MQHCHKAPGAGNRIKKYMKKGNGTVFISFPVFIILMGLMVIFVQRNLAALHIFETQTAADSIADSTAFYMASEYGTYSDAVSRARQLKGIINSNMNVNIGPMSISSSKFQNDIISVDLTTTDNRLYHGSFSARGAADTKFEMLGMAIVRYGMTFLGTPYNSTVGGVHRALGSPPNYFDCSQFVAYVYNHFGYNLPDFVANTPSQFSSGGSLNSHGAMVPSLSQAKPGDIICFMPVPSANYAEGSVGHTGIYIGHGMMIHSGSSNSGRSCVNIKHVSGGGPIQSIRRIIGYEPRRR